MNNSLKDFIDKIIKYKSIDDILNEYNLSSEKGQIYERLWDLIIKFGFCDLFKNHEYVHIIENINNGLGIKMKSLQKYINDNKIISGNSTGYSDITLYKHDIDEWIFISCKYYENEKSLDSYDVQKINLIINGKNKDIYKNYKIYILVNNKKNLLIKVKNANNSSNELKKYFNENVILDKKDLQKYFIKFKKSLLKNKNKNYDDIYLCKKPSLNLRFHQKLTVNKTSDL